MLILNTENLPQKKLYYCYSPPLSSWLQDIKLIFPIANGIYLKPGKYYGNKFDTYVISFTLDEALKEWSVNKVNNTFAVKRCVVDE